MGETLARGAWESIPTVFLPALPKKVGIPPAAETETHRPLTLKAFANCKPSQLLHSCENLLRRFLTQGLKANPGLKLANVFSVRVQTALSHLFSGLALLSFHKSLCRGWDFRLFVRAVSCPNGRRGICLFVPRLGLLADFRSRNSTTIHKLPGRDVRF